MSDQPLDLDAVRAVTDAATPGPWWNLGESIYTHELPPPDQPFDELEYDDWLENAKPVCYGDTETVADAVFIASAREWVPVLVGEVERLRAAQTADALNSALHRRLGFGEPCQTACTHFIPAASVLGVANIVARALGSGRGET